MTIRITAIAGALAIALSGCSTDGFGRSVGPATRSDERIAAFSETLARRPNDMNALLGIGREYARQAQWDRSAAAYREALFVNSRSREAQLGFGAAQAALGGYQSAHSHATRAGSGTEAQNLRGIALAGMRQAGPSIAAFEAAFAANPRDLDIRNNLALALALAGQQRGYDVARGVAFAPGADRRHVRNFFLVSAMLGREAEARAQAARLGVPEAMARDLFAIGRRARGEGMGAFGLAASA